jgi:hypothetical protein
MFCGGGQLLSKSQGLSSCECIIDFPSFLLVGSVKISLVSNFLCPEIRN